MRLCSSFNGISMLWLIVVVLTGRLISRIGGSSLEHMYRSKLCRLSVSPLSLNVLSLTFI